MSGTIQILNSIIFIMRKNITIQFNHDSINDFTKVHLFDKDIIVCINIHITVNYGDFDRKNRLTLSAP